MTEFGIELCTMAFHIGIDFFGCGFQGFEVSYGIPIAKSVIRDDGKALLEKGLKLGMHVAEISNFKSQISMRIK